MTTREIAAEVSLLRAVPVSAILGRSRHREVVRARWEVMYRLRQRGMSLPAIGREFGGMDHTTVLHGLREFTKLMAADRALCDRISPRLEAA